MHLFGQVLNQIYLHKHIVHQQFNVNNVMIKNVLVVIIWMMVLYQQIQYLLHRNGYVHW